VRTGEIEVLHTDDAGRLLAFRRRDEAGEVLVVGSLATTPYDRPSYTLQHPGLTGGGWRECLNTDAAEYGGDGVGNEGRTLAAAGDRLDVVVPSSGVVVFARESSQGPGGGSPSAESDGTVPLV
jgi:1,4-alpha-glucan branching enzyme